MMLINVNVVQFQSCPFPSRLPARVRARPASACWPPVRVRRRPPPRRTAARAPTSWCCTDRRLQQRVHPVRVRAPHSAPTTNSRRCTRRAVVALPALPQRRISAPHPPQPPQRFLASPHRPHRTAIAKCRRPASPPHCRTAPRRTAQRVRPT